MDFAALGLTLRLATITTLVLFVFAVPFAAWIAGLAPYDLAPNSLWGRRLAQAAVALPLVLPPTVLGFYILLGLGPNTLFGRTLIRVIGHPLAFSFAGLVIGSVIFSLPFAVQPLVSGFRAVDLSLIETARALGASPVEVLRRIVLPLSKPALLSAGILTFAHTVGEFGVVLMIGGDIPGITRTLSIAIFDKVQEGDYSAAGHISLLLLVSSFLALLIVYMREFRAFSRYARREAPREPAVIHATTNPVAGGPDDRGPHA